MKRKKESSSKDYVTIQGVKIRFTQRSDIIPPEGGWSFERFEKAAKKACRMKIFDD